MSELFHTNSNLPILIQKLKFVYQEWSHIQKHIPKIHRYSIAVKIDNIFIQVIELSFILLSEKDYSLAAKLISKIDLLKFMILVLFEIHGIDEKKYINLNLKIEEIGKIVFGIRRNIKTTHNLSGK